MSKSKIIDIVDFFDENDEAINPPYIPQITDAKKAINYFNHYFTIEDMYLNISKFKYAYERKWGGADVSIRSPRDKKLIEANQHKYREGITYVYTEFFKELSWLFAIITQVCRKNYLYDYISKFPFYGMLADRANSYISKHDERKILSKKEFRDKYVKNLIDEIIDEFEKYVYQLEKEMTSVH